MADISPIYKLYASKLWQEKNMYGAWPPIMTDVEIGSYGLLTGNGFQTLGNLKSVIGMALDQITAPFPAEGFQVSSESMSIKYFAISGEGATEIPDLDGVGAGDAQIQYTCSSSTNFQVTVDNVAQIDIAPSIEDYLRNTVWPLIAEQAKGTWNSNWRFVGSIFQTNSYVFVGSSQKNTQFALNASGTVLSEYGDGKITANIDTQAISNVGDAMSNYMGDMGVIGFHLWHFDSHGNPQLDQG